MAYTPTEWETGDVITAAKLNNMEQGIEDASSQSMPVNVLSDLVNMVFYLDKTYSEIKRALLAGVCPVFLINSDPRGTIYTLAQCSKLHDVTEGTYTENGLTIFVVGQGGSISELAFSENNGRLESTIEG